MGSAGRKRRALPDGIDNFNSADARRSFPQARSVILLQCELARSPATPPCHA